MLLIQTDSDGTRNAVATGKIVGRYTSKQNKKGFLETEFGICVKSDAKSQKFVMLKVIAYGETIPRIVRFAKLKKDTIIAFGNCAVDESMSALNGDIRYSMYATAVVSPLMMLETYEWHQNSMSIDKILAENAEQNIRYDYEQAPNREDHMI